MHQDLDWPLVLKLERATATSLVEQVRSRIVEAIADGTLVPGTRLPSWVDLAAQLGVARGTVRQAYDHLADANLVIASGARGTHVAHHPVRRRAAIPPSTRTKAGFPNFAAHPLPFQVGVPSSAAFPFPLWTRLVQQAAQKTLRRSVGYPDPGGEPGLRQEIARHLALSRGLSCDPDQVIVTSGYASGLSIVLRSLDLAGQKGWIEEPGYPVAREAMRFAGIVPVSVPVDAQGMDIEHALAHAGEARVAVVTPGQQAPLGVALSRSRRVAMLSWAARKDAWIIEDDYLAELQITGRAAPALASLDSDERTIYIGTFSKTMSPALRLGFIVAPTALGHTLLRITGLCAPAPSPVIQHAMALFMQQGHYLRHLRRMKGLYGRQAKHLRAIVVGSHVTETMAGLALLVRLPPGADDQLVCERARRMGLAPSALSHWYADQTGAVAGLLLSVTNVEARDAEESWRVLQRVVEATRGA